MHFKTNIHSLFTLALIPSLISIAGTTVGMNAHALPPQKPTEDYWRETGLTLDSLEANLENCNLDEKNFLACLSALNAFASFSGKPTIFATAGEKAANEPGLGNLITAHPDGLNEYELSPPVVKTALEAVKLQKAIRSARQAGIQAQIAQHANFHAPLVDPSPVDFKSLFESVRAKVLTGDAANKEAFYTAVAIDEYMQVLIDPHTHIDPSKEIEDETSNADNSFSGIGAAMGTIGKQTIISSFIEGSPAEASDLQMGDIITAVDGHSVEGMSIDKIIPMVKGPEGTPVVLSVKRKDKTVDITIVRKKIAQANVSYKIVNDTGTPYGYIKLRTFMDRNCSDEIKAAVEELTKQGAKGIILDLRGNGGGLLDQAVKMGSLFVGKKNIVTVKSLDGSRSDDEMGASDAITDLPMTTLIDGGSASASEVLSGALQDHQRSWIVGDRSFGKATVQGNMRFDDQGRITLFKTIARFYQPSGRTNQIVGILPNFSVDPSPKATEEEKFSLREEDLYSNALPALNDAWKETRPTDVDAINKCREQHGVAETLFAASSPAAKHKPDYRLFAAEDILNCAKK